MLEGLSLLIFTAAR